MDENTREPVEVDEAASRESIDSEVVTPTFDEGGRRPTPITATGDDNVRGRVPTSSASTERITDEDEGRRHAQATMPPLEGNHPKRNTM